MRVVCSIILGMLVTLTLVGCGGVATEDLARTVQNSIKQNFESRSDMESVQLIGFNLVHVDGSQYRGILEVERNGDQLSVPVDVTYDGENVLWEIDPDDLPRDRIPIL